MRLYVSPASSAFCVLTGCISALLFTSCGTPQPMWPLQEAAIRGDVSSIDALVKQGVPVNATDEFGNTPLHYAYYHSNDAVIQHLTDIGADGSISNKFGATPLDMQKIAQAENLLSSGASILDADGRWVDEVKARVIYVELKDLDADVVTKAIVREVTGMTALSEAFLQINDMRLHPHGRNIDRNVAAMQDAVKSVNKDSPRVLLLAVKLGIPGSEARLVEVLWVCGNKNMAEDYVNSGSQLLSEGGRQWLTHHGYAIKSGSGSHRVGWGRF